MALSIESVVCLSFASLLVLMFSATMPSGSTLMAVKSGERKTTNE